MRERWPTIETACQLCGGTRANVIGAHSDFAECNVVRCIGCGAVFTAPMPTVDYLAQAYVRHYRAAYGQTSAEPLVDFEKMRRRARAQRAFIATCEDLALEGASVLDIGCAAGELLNAFGDPTNRLFGFEPDQIVAAVARQRLGPNARIYNEVFTPELIGDRRFDLVTASHVVEHVPDPVTFLREALSLVKDRGVLFIEVPNDPLKAVREQVGQGVKGLMHLWFFQPESLKRAIRQAGGRVMRLTTYGPSVEMYSQVPIDQHGVSDRLRWKLYRAFNNCLKRKTGLSHGPRIAIDWRQAPSMENRGRGIWIRALVARANPCLRDWHAADGA